MRTLKGQRHRVKSLRMMMIVEDFRDNRVNPREEAVVRVVEGVSDHHRNELHPRARNRRPRGKDGLNNSREEEESLLPRRWILMIQTQIRRMDPGLQRAEGSLHQQEEEEGEERLQGEAGAGQDLRGSLGGRAGAGEDPNREQGDKIDRVATF